MASKRLRDSVGIDPDRVVSAALEAALGAMAEAEPRRKKRHPRRVLAAGAAVAAAAAVGQRRLPRLVKLPLRMGLHKLGDLAHVDEFADALHDRADALRDRLVEHDDEDEDLDVEDEEPLDDEPGDEVDDDFEDEGDVEDEAEDDFEDEDDDEDEGFDDGPEDDDGPRDEGDGEEPEAGDDDDLEADDDPEAEAGDEPPEDDLPEDEEADDADEEDDQVAARGLELGASPRRGGHRGRDHAPDLFEALRAPRRRAPVMRRASTRRGSSNVDPAARPPHAPQSKEA